MAIKQTFSRQTNPWCTGGCGRICDGIYYNTPYCLECYIKRCAEKWRESYRKGDSLGMSMWEMIGKAARKEEASRIKQKERAANATSEK